MEDVIVRDNSHAAKMEFFTQMERNMSHQFSRNQQNNVDNQANGETVVTVINTVDTAEHNALESKSNGSDTCDICDSPVLRRNSFDANDLSDRQTLAPRTVRTIKSSHDLLVIGDEVDIDPAFDMGHLSRRIWMGSSDIDTSERSFGYRRAFNRGSLRSLSNDDDAKSVNNLWKFEPTHHLGSFESGETDEGTTSSTYHRLKHSRSSSPSSSSGPIIVSPLTVSQCLASMIFDVLQYGIIADDVGKHRQYTENSPETSFITGELPAELAAPSLTSEDYEVFRAKDINGRPPPAVTEETIFSFVHTLCAQSQMEYECAVLSFLYLERVIRMSHGMFKLDNGNWKGPVLSCMIMANKVWDDFHMSNVDYVFIFPSLTLQRINELELQLLRVLNANLWVGVGEYAAYHFRVQAHFAQAEVVKNQHGKGRLTHRPIFKQRKKPGVTQVHCDNSDDVYSMHAARLSSTASGGSSTGSELWSHVEPERAAVSEATAVTVGCFSATSIFFARLFNRHGPALW